MSLKIGPVTVNVDKEAVDRGIAGMLQRVTETRSAVTQRGGVSSLLKEKAASAGDFVHGALPETSVAFGRLKGKVAAKCRCLGEECQRDVNAGETVSERMERVKRAQETEAPSDFDAREQLKQQIADDLEDAEK